MRTADTLSSATRLFKLQLNSHLSIQRVRALKTCFCVLLKQKCLLFYGVKTAPGACIISAIPRSSMYVATPVQNLFSGRKGDMQSKILRLCYVVILLMLPLTSGLPMKFVSDSMVFFLPLRPMIIVQDSQDIDDKIFGKQSAVYHTFEPGIYMQL